MRPFTANTLVIATHNPGKLAEFRTLVAPLGIAVMSSGDLHVTEPDETGDSFTANAELKARHTVRATELPSLADDSGLVIPALDGAPGIYSARWAGPDKNFANAMDRVARELDGKGITPTGTPAYFICALCLAWPDGHVEHVEGKVEGRLTFPPRGTHGFGYDPIFLPHGYDLTFGEMQPDAKERISHRAQAFSLLYRQCLRNAA
ncbi:MAG: RdgB/HAM1 family non-canonical purine NTP pyrophosphatase [Alphaproteobacteria bacterium]|nr:RdgB/HAM1 family non-canonical purine NTP pyrophosphatase [Alphaproteobacteria bacterium]